MKKVSPSAGYARSAIVYGLRRKTTGVLMTMWEGIGLEKTLTDDLPATFPTPRIARNALRLVRYADRWEIVKLRDTHVIRVMD